MFAIQQFFEIVEFNRRFLEKHRYDSMRICDFDICRRKTMQNRVCGGVFEMIEYDLKEMTSIGGFRRYSLDHDV